MSSAPSVSKEKSFDEFYTEVNHHVVTMCDIFLIIELMAQFPICCFSGERNRKTGLGTNPKATNREASASRFDVFQSKSIRSAAS